MAIAFISGWIRNPVRIFVSAFLLITVFFTSATYNIYQDP